MQPVIKRIKAFIHHYMTPEMETEPYFLLNAINQTFPSLSHIEKKDFNSEDEIFKVQYGLTVNYEL